MNFVESAYVCEGLGGTLLTPTSHDHAKRMVESTMRSSNCTTFWTGVWDFIEEGSWINHQNGSAMKNVPWAPDEPNGMHFENCGALDAQGVADDDCQAKRCGFCQAKVGRPWSLRGSCQSSPHDQRFLLGSMTGSSSGSSSPALWEFVGYGDFIINWDGKSETWRWVKTTTGHVQATLRFSKFQLPIGRQEWEISVEMCGQKAGTRQLSLSSCEDGVQFSCSDATCVPLEVRCDHKFDCRDHSDEEQCDKLRLTHDYQVINGFRDRSDEEQCDKLHLTHDYQTSVAPRDSNGKLRVEALIKLETLSINTRAMLLDTTFNLTLTWYDSRVTFFNLKHDRSLNTLPTNGTLWGPDVAFVNTLNHAGTISDDRTNMFVHREKKSLNYHPSFAGEVEVFEGSSNPITSHRQYQASFTCDLDLSLYPFDHQNCFLLMKLRGSTFTYFENSTSTVVYNGSALLLEYGVGQVDLAVGDDQTTIKILVPLSRRHGYAFINIYLPSLTMLLIGILTLFFRCRFFDSRVMTSLTTLLVMATLFSQVAATLPNTSYFKMVDIWLLFCIFSTFLVIVFHVLVDRTQQAKEDGIVLEPKISCNSKKVEACVFWQVCGTFASQVRPSVLVKLACELDVGEANVKSIMT
ncbi:uncharacterized protein LOC125178389 [Hyalella azteca]|uniref:Uncharacterized protein LOC125178389 n=1 Tax=Hyalella azteca TaxID=294128 RepID=A0A979FML9_HYAAZ|nr:uncharacterized protein LOC125178389 [Hyalella azteca]